jgi:hypothetical protein
MFIVTLLLNEVIAWMRSQSGTSSLRAILYMDEIFGYFPPTANPPSKTPMLTLLKQARAFGVGVVLATQNPVDIDYKGSRTRAGDRQAPDRARPPPPRRRSDGRSRADRRRRSLNQTKKRTFLLHDVHRKGPRSSRPAGR